MSKMMDFENLSKEGQEAAKRIAARTGETPQQVCRRTKRVFFARGAVYRERNIFA